MKHSVRASSSDRDPSLRVEQSSEPLAASAPAGDAVAWRYRDNDMLDGEWFVSEYEPTPGNWDTIEPLYAHPPGPSEPSPSSRSETAGERALSQAEVRAGINILLETIAAKFDGWATWDVWRSEAASLVRSFKHAPPPSPDCSGCKPSGVQKEDATRIEGSMQGEGANAKSGGAA